LLSLHYKILKYLYKGYKSKELIIKHFSKINSSHIIHALEILGEKQIISDLVDKELEVVKQGKHYEDDSLKGVLGKPTGFYAITDYGTELFELEREEKKQFLAPFIFTAIISCITIVISVISLYYSLNSR
jgi:hypothetical protein